MRRTIGMTKQLDNINVTNYTILNLKEKIKDEL